MQYQQEEACCKCEYRGEYRNAYDEPNATERLRNSGPAHHRINAENAHFYRTNANSKIAVTRKLPRRVGASICPEFSLRSRKCLLNAWQQTGGLWIPPIFHPIPSNLFANSALLTSYQRSSSLPASRASVQHSDFRISRGKKWRCAKRPLSLWGGRLACRSDGTPPP
jgi:hypothetical protein